MNLLIVSNSYVPNAGGVATSVHELATALEQRNWKVLVLTPRFHADDGSDHRVRRLPMREWDAAISQDFRIVKGTALYDRIREFSPQLIHVHGPFHLGPIATRLADDLSLPLVYTHHTKLEEFIHYCDDPNLTPARIQEFYVRFANRCDAVLVPSGTAGAELRQMGVQRPLHAVPTGLQPEWFAHTPAISNLAGAGPAIGIVGRVTKEKKSAELARAAMAHLKEDAASRLLVLGDGESLPDIRREAEDRGLSDRVQCPGQVAREALPAYLDQLDVVINSPESDTQCIVLLEAQARGVPVIAADVPLAREFVCAFDEDIAFYPSGDWAGLQGSLRDFFALPHGEQAAIRRRAREFAARFEQGALLTSLCSVYENLQAEIQCHHDDRLYGSVYRELTRSLVPVIQKLRTP